MSNFRTIDRQTGFSLPPSVDEWLPERHLARFVVEVIDGLDLRAMSGDYRGSGSASYHPSMLLGLLVYRYATGVFSSRKLELATYESVAFRFIAANDHPYGEVKYGGLSYHAVGTIAAVDQDAPNWHERGQQYRRHMQRKCASAPRVGPLDPYKIC